MERADAEKPHMGLMTWADASEGKIKLSDVVIAKTLDYSGNIVTSNDLSSKKEHQQPANGSSMLFLTIVMILLIAVKMRLF